MKGRGYSDVMEMCTFCICSVTFPMEMGEGPRHGYFQCQLDDIWNELKSKQLGTLVRNFS